MPKKKKKREKREKKEKMKKKDKITKKILRNKIRKTQEANTGIHLRLQLEGRKQNIGGKREKKERRKITKKRKEENNKRRKEKKRELHKSFSNKRWWPQLRN